MENGIKTAEGYIKAWQNKDIEGISKYLHPDVEFVGPMAQVKGKQAVVASAERMFRMLRGINVHTKLASGEQAILIYDFVCAEPIGTCRIAELLTMKDGLVARTELFFDARPFEKFALAQRQQAKSA